LVRLRSGTVMLPTDSDTLSAELFEEVLFGPEQRRAEPQGVGTFRVGSIPGPPGQADAVTTYRFTYSQTFALPGGRLLELEVPSPLLFRARGDEPLVEAQPLPQEFFVTRNGTEPLRATLDGEPLVRFGSCTYESLPRWGIEAELEDGTVLSLEERFEEAASLMDTAPASLVRAEVTFGDIR